MKRMLAVILIIVMAVPAVALAADYSPSLGMKMSDYILKYNALQAPLGSPYVLLDADKPELWTTFNEYSCAWFSPESEKKITVLLLSKDPEYGKSTEKGLDMIQIFTPTADGFIPLISIATRCSEPFATDLFGESLASYSIGSIIRYYYENGAEEKGLVAYNQMNASTDIVISFFKSSGYYFQISKMEDEQ